MPAHRKELNIKGPNLWYLVGLIASDGCLCKDGRHIDITAKEKDFLQRIKKNLGLVNKVCAKNKGTSKQAYRIQIANKGFYEFLLSIGLTQNKSLTIGELKVPNEYFIDFVRGEIDGDGCIRKWKHPSNQGEQWSLRICSGSEKFIRWLEATSEILLRIKGKIHKQSDTQWILKYGKMAARKIAEKCYYKNCLGLERKIKLAQECSRSYSGWDRSKTVFN